MIMIKLRISKENKDRFAGFNLLDSYSEACKLVLISILDHCIHQNTNPTNRSIVSFSSAWISKRIFSGIFLTV